MAKNRIALDIFESQEKNEDDDEISSLTPNDDANKITVSGERKLENDG